MATNKKERKKEKMKNNKGITLIALIITIIVMLILVAVTVAVVVNSDLIGTTQKSTQDYKAKEEGERNIAGFNVIVNGEEKYYDSAEDYVEGKEKITFKIDSKTYTAKKGDTWADFFVEGATEWKPLQGYNYPSHNEDGDYRGWFLRVVGGSDSKVLYTDTLIPDAEYKWYATYSPTWRP